MNVLHKKLENNFRPFPDLLQPERTDPHPVPDHGRSNPGAGAHSRRRRRPTGRIFDPRDPRASRPMPGGSDLALRRTPGLVRPQRPLHRPLRGRAQKLRHALHWTLQVWPFTSFAYHFCLLSDCKNFFFKWAIPGLFFVYFRSIQTNYSFYNKLM